MLTIAIACVVISIVAGILGFTGISRGAATIAKVVFGVFLLFALIAFAMIAFGVSLIT